MVHHLTEGGQLLPGSVIRHYRCGHLVLPGVTWSATWCYLGVAWRYLGLYFGVVFFCGPKISAFLKLKLWEKINFHLEMLPRPTPVVVTSLPAPLAHPLPS